MFRVVPDQLRISEGWVRCGQCDEVFDANAHLRNLDAAADTPQGPKAPQPSTPEGDSPEATLLMPLRDEAALPVPQAKQDSLSGSQSELEHGYDWGEVLVGQPPPPVAPAVAPAYAHLELPPDPVEIAAAHDWQGDPVMDHSPRSERLQEETADTLLLPLEESGPGGVVNEVGQTPEAVQLSFMAAAETPSARQWPSRRLLLAACTGLALALLLQVMVQERDAIAAHAPGLRPALRATCEVLDCELSPLRDIDAIAIDSSAFTSVRPGVYLLSATLKNGAATELAMPALELTLTNAQDQALLRRVLLPGEVSSKSALAAGAELSASLPIAVKSGSVPEKIAGYKLLAFYP
jgi:predicted Zn finger-like uncharacterized protein